ncbi:mitochondrial carrier [Irpex rosettiformis]|uniref:Mitochondrial carrier n=1 Tax=Irpex rosettiformis TaxID=378272 RepID=A0ACB8U716_9APHY|nr:mitochondrial carrier [Irpex rosettiformis]
MAAACTHPLDLTKVRLQTIAPVHGHKPSMFSVLRTTVRETGVRSLYTGLSAAFLRQMSYSLVRLGSYEKMKETLSKNGQPSSGSLFLSAMAAGAMGGIAGNPADILLVRMTSDNIRPPEKRYNYSNAISGLFRLIREEGTKGLFRGLEANVVRAVLMNASQVATYDYFKSKLLTHTLPVVNYHFKDNLLCHTASSLLAGAVATTVCSPADVLRSRVMSASCNSGIIDILRTSMHKEGPSFLFKGWTPAFMRLGPNTVLMFVFFEQLKHSWKVLFPAT